MSALRPGDLVRVRPERRVPGTYGKRFIVKTLGPGVVHAWQVERAGIRGKLRSFRIDEVEPVEGVRA
ncbi:MAG TPA: hypothetical protein VNO79_05960 [Actinomycetota bacterium]|nr:hypothetical protein [Actinomycetota bacterium]